MSGSSAAEVRSGLDHPIVDADGHFVEASPLLVDYLVKIAGRDVADRFERRPRGTINQPGAIPAAPGLEERKRLGLSVSSWWGTPTNALDRATSYSPRLLHERLDDLGIDFTILYPSVGPVIVDSPDDDVRRGFSRAVNTYVSDTTADLADRLTVPAVVPVHTPDEALTELEYAIGELGFKAIVIGGPVPRPLPDVGAGALRHDVLGLDSDYDYDPFWARCVELGVPVTCHSGTTSIGLRRSPSLYMYNHVGHFASAGEAVAKAMVLGGVMRRHPQLQVAFLEGGVAWGVQLLCDIAARWEKRSAGRIETLDPRHVDRAVFAGLLARYGGERWEDPAVIEHALAVNDIPPADLDDFRFAGIETIADLVAQFDRFYFGCEADDPTIVWAFADKVNPQGAQLRAILGSDIGHWDVADVTTVVPEAYEFVEHGLLDADQFRAFACDNAIRLYSRANPGFFDGTPIAAYAAARVAAAPAESPAD